MKFTQFLAKIGELNKTILYYTQLMRMDEEELRKQKEAHSLTMLMEVLKVRRG